MAPVLVSYWERVVGLMILPIVGASGVGIAVAMLARATRLMSCILFESLEGG